MKKPKQTDKITIILIIVAVCIFGLLKLLQTHTAFETEGVMTSDNVRLTLTFAGIAVLIYGGYFLWKRNRKK